MLCSRKSSAVLFYSYDTLVSLKICTLLKDSAKRLSLSIRKKAMEICFIGAGEGRENDFCVSDNGKHYGHLF